MPTRLTWEDLPDPVHAHVEIVLGERVVATRGATGGFSPSTAEIVRGASGRAVFVKAVRAVDNPVSVRLNRREADVLAAMPVTAPVPALLAVFEEGPWLVLVTEAAAGAVPDLPWDARQLDAVLAALDELQEAATPCPVPGLPPIGELLGEDLLGFDRVAADPPGDLDPWIAAHLEELCAAAWEGLAAHEGDTLVHGDLRADNLLIAGDGLGAGAGQGGGDGRDGTVRFVDWAWASRGSRVADAVQLLASVEDPDGVLDVDGRLDDVLGRHGVPREVGTAMLSAILGFFVDAARIPDSATVPGLRAHRMRRRDALLTTVRGRWER